MSVGSSRFLRGSSVAALLAVALALAPTPARAQITKDQCVDANGKAQDLRRDGQMTAAREQLRQCSNAACPGIVRDDCAKRLDELDRVQPTIVFDVKDASGRDVSAVSVQVDGRVLTDKLTGSALLVDPGEHVFVFTSGQTTVTQTFVLKEGEKERRERIVLGPASTSPPPAASATAPPATTSAPPSEGAPATPPPNDTGKPGGLGTQKTVGLVAAGAGVVGIGIGSVFGVMTLSAVSSQKDNCASSTDCRNPAQAASAHSDGLTDRTISTVAFIAGGVLLAGGAALFFTARKPTDPPPATGFLVVPAVAPSGGAMLVTGSF